MKAALKILCAIALVAYFTGVAPRLLHAADVNSAHVPFADSGCHDNRNCNN